MTRDNSIEITQELFQSLRQFSRLKWEQKPCRELRPSVCELLVSLYLNLGDSTKSITASELSSQLRITPAGVTHLTNPLEEAGYIERRQNLKDRRVVMIGLTDEGKRFAKTILTETHERLTGLVQYLGEEDSRMIIRLLSSTMTYLEALPEK